MTRIPRTLTAALAATALVGAFSLSAHAQSTPTPTATTSQAAPQHGPRAQPVDAAQRHAQRSEQLKTILQLQPSQQAAWNAYVQATTPGHPAQARAERPDLRTMTTPERLDLAKKLRTERTAKAEQREQATRSFYASLNASQQKAFDAVSVQRHGRHAAGGHKHRMGHAQGHHHGPAGMKHAAPLAPAA